MEIKIENNSGNAKLDQGIDQLSMYRPRPFSRQVGNTELIAGKPIDCDDNSFFFAQAFCLHQIFKKITTGTELCNEMYVFLILIYFIEGNNIRMIGALKDVKLLLKHCDVLFDCTPSYRLYCVICGLGSFLGCETHNAVFTLSKNLAKLIIVLNWVC